MAELMLGNLTKAKQYAYKSLNFNKDSIDGKIALALFFSELENLKSQKLFVSAMLQVVTVPLPVDHMLFHY